MNFSYETVGNSSYLVATFEGGAGVINYQMQMLANNEIKNIIPANKRQKNEDILISYNITSKISLAQVDSMNKIPKTGLINIIEGALEALADIQEYQLVSSGIVFDEEYIFIKPGTFEPGFIYVPSSTEDAGIAPLKQLILSLIVGSKVEMTNDNFVQVLLETLNNPVLTADDLKKVCAKYRVGGMRRDEFKAVVNQQPEPKPAAQPKPEPKPEPKPVMQPKPEPKPEPVAVQPESVQRPVTQTVQRPVVKPDSQAQPKPASQPAAKKAEKPQKSSGGKKVLFIALQAVLVVAIVAILFSGALNNEDGSINFAYVGGIFLVAAAVDFIIYREMFVNNKSKDEAAAPAKKAPAKKAPPSGKPAPAMPGKGPVAMPKGAPQPAPKPVSQPAPEPVQEPAPEPIPQPAPIPQPTYVAPEAIAPQMINDMDMENENTVIMSDSNEGGAYLEYYENGISSKIKLTRPNFVIGKLRNQCDYVLMNNKISKIHAEFITRGNEYFIKDFNSTNGTYINGSADRIQSNMEYQIYNGDRITLANVDLTFKC